MTHLRSLAMLAAIAGLLAPLNLQAASPSQTTLAAASQANKFCFLLFYKVNDPATQAASKTLSQGVAKRADRATFNYVNVTDPNEQAIVKQFNAARAPMPFMVAVAPNGAVTCVFPKAFVEDELDQAFVTPTMTRVMKQIQSGKIVLLCVQTPTSPQYPLCVTQFAADPHFSERSAVLAMRTDDPFEARFLADLKIDAAKAKDTTIVFLAPPGVMVGKYPSNATKAQLASELHAAGKCCDDPNCKHNHKHK